MSLAKREQIIRSLSHKEAEELFYTWPFWARPAQLAPEGNWIVWLILAGRGFGKTRSGGEWIRQRVEQGARRLIIAGPTAGDTRDAMIEGESGLLAISPPWNKPRYEPSKARVSWPNGAMALVISADEPDRFRNKQCLVGDSAVLLADGTSRPLREIASGDIVATRAGPKRVLNAWMTMRNAEVFRLRTVGGRVIIGTADHPVWVEGMGFLPMGSLTAGMSVCAVSACDGEARRGIATMAATTSQWSACIVKCGRPRTARFPKTSTSTTRTKIRRTTAWTTSNSYPDPITVQGTTIGICDHTSTRRAEIPTRPCGVIARRADGASSYAPSAVGATRAGGLIQDVFARHAVLSGLGLAPSLLANPSANNARSRLRRPSAFSDIARGVATLERARSADQQSATSFALNAPSPSLVNGPTHDSANRNAVSFSTDVIACVEKCETRADVYDLEVEDAHEFVANGIVVHNCDTFWADELAAWRYPEAWDQLQFGFRLGAGYIEPRGVVTTTPRPTEIIKKLVSDPTTALTGGSSYENRANLAPAFFAKIVAKYAGTRLGRQELEAQILDDAPGALWKRTQIDATRVDKLPELKALVIAIDPATTSGEDSDETGITIAGVGIDGHGYVLEDLSGHYTPAEWGALVVTEYHRRRINRIVAEINQGGELVTANIKAAAEKYEEDKHKAGEPTGGPVFVVTVHAKQGKRARAEPVAALYEQGRVHHFGVFPELEDQQCSWEPGETDSPDRLDSVVYALTELMVEVDPRRAQTKPLALETKFTNMGGKPFAPPPAPEAYEGDGGVRF